jgi:PAS domain S-box-containing protein
MAVRFSDLVDIPTLHRVMESLWQASGLSAGILEPDGTILVATGTQRICSEFHCPHPEAGHRCRESRELGKERPAETGQREGGAIEYVCRNGLVEVAIPVIIEKMHLATLFLGQFFYRPPDEAIFRARAVRLGFEEEKYLEALREVPIFSTRKVRDCIAFYSSFVSLLTHLGTQKRRWVDAENARLEKERRLGLQNEAILRLGTLKSLTSGDFESASREILETTARTLNVERVSIWLYSRNRSKIRCSSLFELSSGEISEGMVLAVKDYPAYFAAIEKDRTVTAHGVHSDPRMAELRESYPWPKGITSMLDAPVRINGKTGGILCCEHVGPVRQWSLDEQNFVSSMADLFALALEEKKRRRAEDALRESEAKYRLLFTSESDAIIIFDPKTLRILDVNPAAAQLYHYPRKEFRRLHIGDISAEPDKYRERVNETVSRDGLRIPLAYHRKRKGDVFPVEIASGPFFWKNRRLLVGIVRDITERQAIARMKDDMLSGVSHEMRTPLTAMIGFTQYLLDNDTDPEKQQEYLALILRESERLQELIENLLSLQRFRAGFGLLDLRPVDICALMHDVANLFGPTLDKHRLVIECPPGLETISCDEKKIRQALINLLSNAIKYSPDGGTVILGARMEGDFALLWVRDEGIGIPEDSRDQIFERFVRLWNPALRKVGGTGLGLALVKEIVTLHRGRAWVESAPGRGSIFYLSLPLPNPENSPGRIPLPLHEPGDLFDPLP